LARLAAGVRNIAIKGVSDEITQGIFEGGGWVFAVETVFGLFLRPRSFGREDPASVTSRRG